jgi:hypothetical protein
MAERSTISQGIQLGKETTYGTGVTANKFLPALNIMPSPDLAFETYRGSGNKFLSISALTQQSTAVDIPDSPLTYTECVYPFSSLMGAATITTPGGATNSRQWEFIVAATAADTPVSFTVQRGDGTLYEKFTGFVVNSLSIAMEVGSGVTMTGDGFGKVMAHSSGAMDSTSGTQPTLVPVLPTQISVYMDDYGAPANAAAVDAIFGTTKLTRPFAASPTFGNRYSRVYALDATEAGSSVAVVEVPVDFACDMSLEADATGWGLMSDATTGAAKLIRIEAVGAEIESGHNYTWTLDFVGRISDGGDTDDRDGAEQINWTFSMMYDATWGKAMRLRVINNLTAL